MLVSRLRFGDVVYESKEHILKPGPVKLVVKGEPSAFTFLYSQGNEYLKEVQKANPRFLSSETAGGFTGLYAGLYTTGNGKPCKSPADFDWFEYTGEN